MPPDRQPRPAARPAHAGAHRVRPRSQGRVNELVREEAKPVEQRLDGLLGLAIGSLMPPPPPRAVSRAVPGGRGEVGAGGAAFVLRRAQHVDPSGDASAEWGRGDHFAATTSASASRPVTPEPPGLGGGLHRQKSITPRDLLTTAENGHQEALRARCAAALGRLAKRWLVSRAQRETSRVARGGDASVAPTMRDAAALEGAASARDAGA